MKKLNLNESSEMLNEVFGVSPERFKQVSREVKEMLEKSSNRDNAIQLIQAIRQVVDSDEEYTYFVLRAARHFYANIE